MNKQIVEKIISQLKLLSNEYCILGSASLVLRRLKENAHDLDIAITKKGLRDLKQKNSIIKIKGHYVLLNNSVDVEFIIRAKEDMKIEFYQGYPLQNLEQLLENKKKRNLEKDKEDIQIIEEKLKKNVEYLSLYDEEGKITGEIIARNSNYILPNNRYIMTTIVFIINSQKELIIQKTSSNRGEIYATTGGHVRVGTTSLETIKEEIKEELGLDIQENDFFYLGRQKLSYKFQDIYLLQKDVRLEELILQEEEVTDVEWLSFLQIDSLIKKGIFRESNIYGYYLLKKNINKQTSKNDIV